MRGQIISSGIGWIFAGAICIVIWGIEMLRNSCSNCNNPIGLLYTGIFVVAIGAALILFNGRIGKFADKMYRAAGKKKWQG